MSEPAGNCPDMHPGSNELRGGKVAKVVETHLGPRVACQAGERVAQAV
jgi:hypothetical protein